MFLCNFENVTKKYLKKKPTQNRNKHRRIETIYIYIHICSVSVYIYEYIYMNLQNVKTIYKLQNQILLEYGNFLPCHN